VARITDNVIRPAHALLLTALVAGGCATAPPPPAPVPSLAARSPDPTPFSAAVSLEGLPPGWKPYRIARFKKPTDYRLVSLEGTVALQATADASASGVHFDTLADPREYPWLSWKWKVKALNPRADNTLSHVEDSPARVIVVFEGGREKLAPDEQMNFDLAKAMSGNDLPYATLMYIWENRLPEGAVIAHHFTSRIKMIVAGSGQNDLGAWHEERVNVLEDYRRAFGEEPPRIRAVGIMSDSDNTGARTVAWFGDIRFGRP
jgi:hypothetical protein